MRTCLQRLQLLTTSSHCGEHPCKRSLCAGRRSQGIISRSGLSGPKVKSILFYIYLFSCVGIHDLVVAPTIFLLLLLLLWHVGSSSLTRDQTQPPALEAQSLSHWTTREVPQEHFKHSIQEGKNNSAWRAGDGEFSALTSLLPPLPSWSV